MTQHNLAAFEYGLLTKFMTVGVQTMFPLDPPGAVSPATIPSSASVADLMQYGDVVAGGTVIDLTVIVILT
jgi:hypothetical protein